MNSNDEANAAPDKNEKQQQTMSTSPLTHMKSIQKDIYNISEECASLELTKQDISDEVKEQVESLQKELSKRMVMHIFLRICSWYRFTMKAQWHHESSQWPQHIRSLFEKEYNSLKEQEHTLNSRAQCDFQGISDKMARLHVELKNLSELYNQKLEEFLAPIKAIIILIVNNAGSGAKYIARTLTTLATSFHDLFQRVDSLYEGEHRFELYFDHDDVSYQVGTTEELMFVYEVAVNSQLDKIKLRVQDSLKKQ